jgi:hypothetical protein
MRKSVSFQMGFNIQLEINSRIQIQDDEESEGELVSYFNKSDQKMHLDFQNDVEPLVGDLA